MKKQKQLKEDFEKKRYRTTGMPGRLIRLHVRLLVSAQRDLRVVGLSSMLASVSGVEPAWDSLSLPLPLHPPQINKYIKKYFLKILFSHLRECDSVEGQKEGEQQTPR